MTTITAPAPAGIAAGRTTPRTALRDIATISRRNLRRVLRTRHPHRVRRAGHPGVPQSVTLRGEGAAGA